MSWVYLLTFASSLSISMLFLSNLFSCSAIDNSSLVSSNSRSWTSITWRLVSNKSSFLSNSFWLFRSSTFNKHKFLYQSTFLQTQNIFNNQILIKYIYFNKIHTFLFRYFFFYNPPPPNYHFLQKILLNMVLEFHIFQSCKLYYKVPVLIASEHSSFYFSKDFSRNHFSVPTTESISENSSLANKQKEKDRHRLTFEMHSEKT